MGVGAMSEFQVRRAEWAEDGDAIRAVRLDVFVDEQEVPADLEFDEHDATSVHLLAADSHGQPIGTGRLLSDGHIGRMAVVKAWRGRGVGGALLKRFIELAAAAGLPETILSAQTHAIPFYERYGFVAEGDPYLDAGIPHRTMRRLR